MQHLRETLFQRKKSYSYQISKLSVFSISNYNKKQPVIYSLAQRVLYRLLEWRLFQNPTFIRRNTNELVNT